MLRVHAHAKINLCLAVDRPEPSGPRAGWHRLCSWMCCVRLHDVVELRRASGESAWRVCWETDAGPRPVEWSDDKDLGVRAHRALEARLGRPLPTEGSILKSVPAGAGLGGGSSDAAAVLIGLNELFGLRMQARELQEIARPIGSDIAYFIDQARIDTAREIGEAGTVEAAARPAIVRGFGDEIERLSAARARVMLVLPEHQCSTPEVYRAFDSGLSRDHVFRDAECERLARGTSLMPAHELFNDLAGPAGRVTPAVERDRACLGGALARPVHVSGSGSALFVLVEPAEDERALASRALDALEGSGSDTLRLVFCDLC